jgi:glycosyltransferase involved in cell wall biosynthesis
MAFLVFALLAMVRVLRIRADVIFATSTPLTIAVPALVASSISRKPFVFEVRDMWPDVPIAIGAISSPVVRWLALGLERVTYRRSSHIVALAPGMRDDIVRKGVPAVKVSVIPNGCDLEVFAAPQGVSPRSAFSWLGERKVVLFAGAFGIVNGVDYFVRLAKEMSRLDPEVRFVAIGSGRDWERVRFLANTEGVLGSSYFQFGALAKRELGDWLGAADIVVALFTGPRVVWKDAVQNKFFDALAAGRPVACNFDGWQSQLAVHEECGLILNADDLELAARQLLDVLRDETWMQRARQRARTLAEGRFNRDSLAMQLETLLTGIAG